jgi:hypothetical protein
MTQEILEGNATPSGYKSLRSCQAIVDRSAVARAHTPAGLIAAASARNWRRLMLGMQLSLRFLHSLQRWCQVQSP